MNAASPTEFGRYELIERLAVGGMAELYKARGAEQIPDEGLKFAAHPLSKRKAESLFGPADELVGQVAFRDLAKNMLETGPL